MLFINDSMKSNTSTLAKLMEQFRYHSDLRTVFDDLLTMTICSFGQNPVIGKSYDENLYLEIIGKYKNSDLRFLFPEMLSVVTMEMERRMGDSMGNDVLGEYYELHLANKELSQFFTPWPICQLLTSILTNENRDRSEPKRVLDPACGSGRTLLCGANLLGRQNSYYGIDVDHICVKMAAINLFLNGVFHAEVMCANALMPGDFRVSYMTSFLPFGLFRITEKEKSPLWHMYQKTFEKLGKVFAADIKLSTEGGTSFKDGTQLTFF